MHTFKFIFASFFVALVVFSRCQTKSAKEDSAIQLFPNDTTYWQKGGEAKWTFDGGKLIGQIDSGGGFMMTKESYKNFELTLDFKPDSTINSGVFIRCQNQELSAEDCFEINIWDLHPNQDFRTGSIVTRAKPLAYVETIDKWNVYKIVAKDNTITVWVNDTKTAEYTGDGPVEGFIGLQAAGEGEISFRNISLSLVN